MTAGASSLSGAKVSSPELADLRMAFEHLRTVLASVGAHDFPPEHGILLLDADRRIVWVTSRLEELLGLSSAALVGQTVATLSTHLGLSGLEGEPDPDGRITWTHHLPDGSYRVLRHRSAALRDATGRPLGTLCFFQDATAASARSRELQEKSRELDEARDRLTRAQHLKALGQLAAEVAHEFGNLLQAIGLQTAALQRQRVLPGIAEPALHSIKQAVDVGRALTRRLLTFARDDEHERMKSLDVARVLQDIVQLLEPRLNRHGPPLRVELSLPCLPPIDGNATKLTEAFLNLFLNALDAMPEGGVLDVSAVERSGEIRIAIRDTGKGMTVDEQRRAFDPFFTTKPGGTGLGLSTVYGVVRAHRGSIFIESELGKGTTVFVSLPTAAPPAIVRSLPTHAARDAGCVLVVDDHPTVRDATAELLATQGYTVESAATVADALEAIERREFTVVVTDVGLPDRPGWEVARAAKRRSMHTVVVLVSGWGSHFSRDEARARGADLVFEKPVDPDVLLSAIGREIAHVAG
jgi:signal transduction histidine kinase/CheY-like chemotaxis protein